MAGRRRAFTGREPSMTCSAAMDATRFARGMTFDDYVTFTGSSGNLARAGFDVRRLSPVRPRLDWSGYPRPRPARGPPGGRRRVDGGGSRRERHARARLTPEQTAAIGWLAAQPGGPAKVAVIAEAGASDCRRDPPYPARLAEGGARR